MLDIETTISSEINSESSNSSDEDKLYNTFSGLIYNSEKDSSDQKSFCYKILN